MTIANFEEKLQKYAELIVKVGVNVQPGQEVVLYINVEQQHLAHLIVKEAYKAGAFDQMDDTFGLLLCSMRKAQYMPVAAGSQ